MQIDVDHVAKLARLGLSEEEKKLFAKQLADILDFAASLQKIKIDNVPPSSHAIPIRNIWREDEVKPFANIPGLLANAPAEENGAFKVPRIME
jgi:aspartyl-tRNA(Asn)/glutamyl-tRNA(Gln) amidotransferase subunit C